MLARRCKLTHDGWDHDLPLLVPSFSSKGSDFKETQGARRQYDVAGDLRDFGHRPAKSVLVSAYDLHFGHLDITERDEHVVTAVDALRCAELVFLDSGGYELAPSFDSCEPKVPPYVPRAGYDEAAYRKVIERLDTDPGLLRLVLTSFDHAAKGKPIDEQVTAAKRLFGQFPRHLHSFIIKPTGEDTIVHPDRLTDAQLGGLRAFQIVGVTEKELGANLMDRLKRIAVLRRKLDAVEVAAPLHIWGGLDPMVTPLYYFAGAQIFDGVSWLRYGFLNGQAVSRDSYQVLDEGLGVAQNRILVRGSMALRNRVALDNLAGALRECVDGGGRRFSMFSPGVRTALERAYQTMKASIEGV